MSKKDILSYSIVLIPLLKPYLFFGINADVVGLVLMCLFSAIFLRLGIRIPKQLRPYCVLIIYSSFIPPLIGFLMFGDKFSITFLPFVILIYMGILSYVADFQKVFHLYKYIVLICCFFLFFQEIWYYLTSVRVSGLLPFLDNVYSQSWGISSDSFIERQSMLDRSSSFFLEPAHFAQYIAPCLAIMLLKKEYFSLSSIMIITSAMIMSRSGNALLLLGVIFVMFALTSQIKKVWKFSISFLFLIGLVLFLGTEEGMEFMARTDELSLTDMERHSGFIRAYRGYFLWADLNPIQQFFGMGLNIDSIYDNIKYSWMFLSENDKFLNGVQTLMIMNGIVGVLIFLYFMYSLCKIKNIDYLGKTIVISFICLMLIESIYNSSYMILYLSLVVLNNKSYLRLQNVPE